MLCFELLTECENDDQLREEAGRFALQIGFELWAFSALVPTGRSEQAPAWSVGNFPAELESARLDCFVQAMGSPQPPLARHGIPQGWLAHRRSPAPANGDPAMETFRQHAARHGLNAGLSVPVPAAQGFSALMLATRGHASERALHQARPAALLFARYLHLACTPQIERFARERRPRLRTREIECLSWAALGKTTWEISRLLSISHHTVDFHLRNACERLDVASRQRAVAKAMELGLLGSP